MKPIAHFFSPILALCLSLVWLSGYATTQPPHPRSENERFVIKDLEKVRGAQATYAATAGNGSYGTLAQLHTAGFIDAALASGIKNGYTFSLQLTPNTPTASSNFVLTATPRIYRKTGRRSFYLDPLSGLLGDDLGGAAATSSSPEVETCALYGLADNERCTILDLRTLHGAEMTYAATEGNGNFGLFPALADMYLIRRSLATYSSRGYSYQVEIYNSTTVRPATFKIRATPQIYGVTGRRSFFIATDGVIRGADNGGVAADENDPEIDDIEFCGGADRCSASAMRTLHGAEMTYAATAGNGNYGTLSQLSEMSLIGSDLSDGVARGYRYTINISQATSQVPASFSVTSVPITYGVTGTRSFFIGLDGVLRGADKQGQPADENDPPINY